MSTRSSARNLFPPLDNSELTIERRSHTDPTLLNNSEMAAEGNDDLPVPDIRTMEELRQQSLIGRGGPIAPIAIQATNFELKNDMIQQVLNSCQFHGPPGDDANKHLDKLLHVTSRFKVNGVTDDALRLYLFPHSLTHHATVWFDRLPRISINTFEQMAKMFLDTFYNGLTLRHRDTINAAAGGTFMKRRLKEYYDLIENMTAHHNYWDTSAQRSESSSSITSSFDTEIKALKAEMAEINKNIMRVLQPPLAILKTYMMREPIKNQNFHNQTGIKKTIILKGTTKEETNSSMELTKIPQQQVVTTNEFTNFMMANDAILKNMQTNMTSLPNTNLDLKNMFGQFMKMNTASSSGSRTLPVVASIIEPVAYPVSAPKPNHRPSIPYPSRLHDQKLRDKANDQREKFFQIFKDLNFNIRFAYAFILMLNFGPSIKSLLTNKDKLCELARTPLNEHCSTVLLKKLLEKLGDPGKFLILCDFPRIAGCLALADLGASINLMPLSVWNKLSLPDLSPMCMTLELVDRSISHPVGVAEDTSRYSANYNEMTANYIDVIDMACEEYSQEVLGFFDVITSGNPTPYYDLIVSTTSLTLTPFRNSEFFLEEVNAFLDLEDDPTSPEVDQYYVDTEGDIILLEAKTNKSLIDEPLKVELKDLPPHLKYVFVEGDDKFPFIIAKYLSAEEETAFITVLKSHKQAIAWKLSDIKGIDPEIYTHKILMEEDFELAVQHQRRVNPKIHDVIKNEVLKLLDAGLIYPISDSPWVSPVHCVPKKGGFTIVENVKNELILTCLVTDWRVCIDYHKLNEATHKDHFPLPFIDQMLERLAGNQYCCFLDGFSGYFQIPIDPKDQEKTTFTCPYGMFDYRRMPFGLCNAPGTFQRCMMAIFHDMIEKTMEVFMDDFSVFRNSFQTCLSHLERMLKQCEDTNLCLNWEKSHFMVKEGIVLGHKISKEGIEVDKAKVDVIAKLPHPTTVKGIRSFLGHAGFYRSDFAIGAVLGQRQEKHFRPIHYASKTMTEAESNYTTTEKEMLVVVYAFEKFRSYLIMNKNIVYTDHFALKYLFAKNDSKARLLCWVLLLQEFRFKVIDTKGAENLAANHLS
nr:reverse transcriptase domain-containing protein [Tanacetum cinerariifolium]